MSHAGIKQIILVHHTHTDIGYTGTYAPVTIQHIRHFRKVLALCQEQGSFRWTVESGWPLEMFLAQASKDEKDELTNCILRGQIEITGFYGQPLTQLCNLEELCTALELNFRLTGPLKPRITTLMLNDVGGWSYNIPQIARYYGIRCIVNGCGGWRVMLPFTPLPRVFYLTGPDASRVLFYHIGDDVENRQPALGPAQYGFGVIYFLWPMLREMDNQPTLAGDDGEKTILNLRGREGIDILCRRLAKENYPYDTLLVQLATDNGGPQERLVEAIDEWNRRYGEPQIGLGTCEEFFADLEARYGPHIPQIQGELTCSWTEHAITNARATGRSREIKRKIGSWGALEACRTVPQPDGETLWWSVMKNLALYDDHTFGLSMWKWEEKVAEYGSIAHEAFDLPRESWETKTRYVDESRSRISRAMNDQVIALTEGDPDLPRTISVFNPHSFAFTGMVTFATAQPAIALVDADGSMQPVDSIPINTKWVLHKGLVKNVPPYGVAVFEIKENTAEAAMARYGCDGWTLTGPIGRVEIDPQSGGVRSICTTGRDRDWINSQSAHVNDIVHSSIEGVAPLPYWNGLEEKVHQKRSILRQVERLVGTGGHYSSSMGIRRHFDTGGRTWFVETHYVLDETGLSIRNRFGKIHTPDREACYVAFPFKLASPFYFHAEQQGQLTRFPDERLPGATNHNFGIQDFIAVSDSASQVVLTSFQACLIALGSPSYYHFGLEYQPIETPTMFSYAFNNLWNTNCPVTQQGELSFDYHLGFFNHPFDPVTCYQCSKSAVQPAVVLAGDLRRLDFCDQVTNLFSLSTDQVLVESIRPAGEGIWQIRLVEIARTSTSCSLTLSPQRFRKYALVQAYGLPTAWQSIHNDQIGLDFRGAEFKTLLLRT